MDLLAAIDSRASALKLSEPGPSREHLELIMRAGARAPDHGRLRPWRFVVLEGAARDKLGAELARLSLAKFPQSTPEQLDGERRKVLRAPTIVVAAAHVTPGKIPEVEQIAAVAAGVENMVLAAQALGYGAMWKTGAAAYDPQAKAALGLSAADHIVAFLYLGTTTVAGTATPPSLDGIVSWMQ
ncbi:MAG TPA: nitroreductase [Steroidobacteraceae bacterium]|nr:nitroreductase [Steroidobacteraceae bacterium]